MSKPKITIVGLGLIGNSIGLALSRHQRDFEIVGHDKAPAATEQAKKLKAVDRAEWNLISACDGAGLIVLALPLLAIRETMQALAGELSAGAVVMDTASVKAPVQAWADELLPGAPFIGTNPVVSTDQTGGAAARADLFERRAWAICPSPTTDPGAVKMATDLAERAGAKPLYMDALEHDGMAAAVEQLPALVSMALLSSAVSQPGWREMRQLAGAQFEGSTRLVSTDPHVFSDAMLHNPEQVARWVDSFIENMAAWRDLIAAGDQVTLDKAFVEAAKARERWLHDRSTGQWAEDLTPPVDQPGILTSLLGLGKLSERLRREKNRR